MTKEDYYLCSNKFNNCIHASAAAFFTEICITAFVFEFCNSILGQLTRYIVQTMKCNENN